MIDVVPVTLMWIRFLVIRTMTPVSLSVPPLASWRLPRLPNTGWRRIRFVTFTESPTLNAVGGTVVGGSVVPVPTDLSLPASVLVAAVAWMARRISRSMRCTSSNFLMSSLSSLFVDEVSDMGDTQREIMTVLVR